MPVPLSRSSSYYPKSRQRSGPVGKCQTSWLHSWSPVGCSGCGEWCSCHSVGTPKQNPPFLKALLDSSWWPRAAPTKGQSRDPWLLKGDDRFMVKEKEPSNEKCNITIQTRIKKGLGKLKKNNYTWFLVLEKNRWISKSNFNYWTSNLHYSTSSFFVGSTSSDWWRCDRHRRLHSGTVPTRKFPTKRRNVMNFLLRGEKCQWIIQRLKKEDMKG